MHILLIINLVFGALFLLCYLYQIVLYTPLSLLARKRPHKDTQLHKLAILIAARNEEGVIGQLLDSLRKQDYPQELVHIFVVADNCTDQTKRVAEEGGATVYVRHDTKRVGKGFALDFLLSHIDADFGANAFDAFIVFDADNLVKKTFLTEINKTYSDGYEIVTAYRNTKNYGASWVAAATGMWFLRVCSTLNRARSALGSTAELQGTGFLFSNKIKEENGGWPFHLLTEDTEFLVDSVTKGYTVGYAHDAEFFDEQPISFRQSFVQRLRWAKGGIQVFKTYAPALLRGLFSKNFMSCFDLLFCIAPAFLLAAIVTVVDIVGFIVVCCMGEGLAALAMFGIIVAVLYVLLTLVCALVTVAEWKRLHAPAWKKIWYTFTFAPFMFTYIPVVLCAMLSRRVSWEPIQHTGTEHIEDLQ